MATISLGQFERDHGINRGTVQKQAQAMGFSTSDGLNDEALQALQAYYKVGPFAPKSTAQQPEATGSGLVLKDPVPSGLDTPTMRTRKMIAPDILSQTYSNPMAIAAAFAGSIDEMCEGHDEYLSELDKRLTDSRLAIELVTKAVHRGAIKQREAEIQAAVKTELLKDKMAELQRHTGVQ